MCNQATLARSASELSELRVHASACLVGHCKFTSQRLLLVRPLHFDLVAGNPIKRPKFWNVHHMLKKTPYVQAYTLTTKIFKTHICHNILKAVNADWQHFQDPLSPHALEARKACGDLNFQPLNMWHFCGNKQIKSWFPNIAFVRLGLLILVFHYRTRYSIISVSHAFFKQCSHASGERGRLWR